MPGRGPTGRTVRFKRRSRCVETSPGERRKRTVPSYSVSRTRLSAERTIAAVRLASADSNSDRGCRGVPSTAGNARSPRTLVPSVGFADVSCLGPRLPRYYAACSRDASFRVALPASAFSPLRSVPEARHRSSRVRRIRQVSSRARREILVSLAPGGIVVASSGSIPRREFFSPFCPSRRGKGEKKKKKKKKKREKTERKKPESFWFPSSSNWKGLFGGLSGTSDVLHFLRRM